jgi:hypothetical protein
VSNRASTELSVDLTRLPVYQAKGQVKRGKESEMAWRTQKEIMRDRDQDRRDRERREVRDNSAWWDGGGCECEDGDDRE